MKFLNLIAFIFVIIFFNACASKSLTYSNTKFYLNFVNKTDSTIENVSIYSSKEKKKIAFSHIPKNGFSSYTILRNNKEKNLIVLSWKYKNRVFRHEIKTENGMTPIL